ncbi:MAG: sugar-transfer associated ATP-grasp domain-containing protein [Lysobacterales bacterium]|jgi:hypothetical protein
MNQHDEFTRLGIVPNVRMNGAFELQMRCWFQMFRLLRAELTTRTGLPIGKRMKAWRSGFSSRSWLMYDLDHRDPEQYLPDLLWAMRFFKVNGFFNPIIGNKLVLSRMLSAHGVPHPAVVSVVVHGRLLVEDESPEGDNSHALMRSLERYPRQVFRPTWSGSGQGVFFLEAAENGLRLNGHAVTLAETCDLIGRLDRYLATERVEQAGYARSIYSGSTNTIRLMSLWDKDSGSAFAAAISHRFGSDRSAPLDNWHQGRGGVCAGVDVKTGVLGPALRLSADHRLIWEPSHPDTGEPIEGVKVPGFAGLLDGVLSAAGQFPFCPCVGWDVVVTEDGFRIIEANPIPGLTVSQALIPLLKDPRARRIFQDWGVAPKR